MAVNKIIFNGENVLDLTQDTATAQDVRQGKKFHLKNGASSTGTLIPGVDVSDTTATANDVVQGKYFYLQNGQRVEGNIAKFVGSSTNFVTYWDSVTFNPGYYQQAITVKIDETQQNRFKPENIKDGVVLMGVAGNYVGQGIVIEGQTTNYRVNATTNVNKGEFVELINTDNTIRPTTMGNTSIGIAKESGAGGETIQIYTPNPAYNVDIYTKNCSYSTIVNPMRDGTSQSITFNANTGYVLPAVVTVYEASHSWDRENGILTITNPTDNISISVIAEIPPEAAIVNPLNGGSIEAGSEHVYEFENFTPTTVVLNGTSSNTSVSKTIVEKMLNGEDYSGRVTATADGVVYTDNFENTHNGHNESGSLSCSISFSDGVSTLNDTFTAYTIIDYPCLAKGTLITLSDGTTKKIEDINYNDLIRVWDFDNGEYTSARPLWIMSPKKASYYYKLEFESGNKLKVIGSNGKAHRLFSIEDNKFISSTDLVGKHVYTTYGKDKLVSCTLINEEIEYYNIITNYHINMFANNILTSCRYNNIYDIKDMKFIKDNREKTNYNKFQNIPYDFYVGLRLEEQTINIEKTNKYVSNLIRNKL